MDYIQEELLRQRKILSVLMTGGQREEPEESASENGEMSAWLQSAEQEENRFGQGAEASAVHLRRQGGDSGYAEAANRMPDFRGGRIRAQGRSTLPDPEEPAALVRAVPYERSAPIASVGVREVSRSIQRDARRYDGGFSIY